MVRKYQVVSASDVVATRAVIQTLKSIPDSVFNTYVTANPSARAYEAARDLLAGTEISGYGPQSRAYRAVHLRLRRARDSTGVPAPPPLSWRQNRGDLIARLSARADPIEIEAVLRVLSLDTRTTLEFVGSHPDANLGEFTRALVGLTLPRSGSTYRASRLASAKLRWARAKLGIRPPSRS